MSLGFIFLVLLTLRCDRCEPLLPSIASKLKKVIFVYPTGAQSERDLPVCPENSACNIIHKRFWLPPLIERLCRCPQRRECKWNWSEEPDNYTTMLDNRSQIKFCSDLSELTNCTLKKSAIKITTESSALTTIETATVKNNRNNQKSIKPTERRTVTSLCHCKEPHFWKLKPNLTKYDEETDSIQQFYVCSKLKKCSSMEFCGHVRIDTYSTFYRCSCPEEHMCLSKDKTSFKTEEMLFSGYAYKAFCLPVKN